MSIVDTLIALINAAACLRLLFYRRSGARFKRHISCLAYLLIVLTGSLALSLFTGQLSFRQIPQPLLIALIALAVAVFYAKGNLAQLLRDVRSAL